MFRRSGKKTNVPQENTPINPNIQGVLNNAMRINHQAHLAAMVDQTQGNLIVAGPSTSAPTQVITGQTDLPQRVGGRRCISSSVSIGCDEAFNEVCRFLTENDVAMVGIYGMGGVGKTTLMRKIWNEFLEPSSFEVLFVVVSKTVNVDRIQEEIMKQMGLPFEKDAHPFKRARYINKAITSCSRKLALLFDDIWEVLDLDEIANLGAIDLNTSIFKVIFTTRLEDVCSQMQPHREIKIQPLGWDDSWAVFAKNVGDKTLNSNNEILELAKSVAKECGGLPLALIVIGRAMTCQYSREAWENALFTLQTSPSKFSRSEEKLFSILKFSYDNIQNSVEKECFLFCCLYPEDCKIDRCELVEFWIGDGILDLDGSYHETCNRGHAIVDRLLAACLLELEDGDLTMHDIVRDMGLWITSESRFFVHDGRSKSTKDQLMSKWREAHGIYVLKWNGLPERPYCQNLSTLILNINLIQRFLISQSSLFQFMDKLRILKLIGNFGFSDKSYGILGQLNELRHLSLLGSCIRKFPPELGNLRKLTVLEVCFEYDIVNVSLPPAIGQLTELRRLLINGFSHTKVMLPVECGMLSKLEELSIQLIVDDFMNLFQGMGELRKLKLNVLKLPADLCNLAKLEHLRIQFFELLQGDQSYRGEDVQRRTAEDIGLSIAGLKQLSKSLRVVELHGWPIFEWDDIRSALEAMTQMSELSLIYLLAILEINVISKTTCFSNLKKLCIRQCPQLEKLQVGRDALNGLSSLTIKLCDSLEHIIGLEHLQCLRDLTIENCPELEGELIKPNEGIGSSSPTLCFPRLESLYLRHLPQLKVIGSDSVSFTCLSSLNVHHCDKLEKFPKGLMNEERPLEGVIIGKEKWWEGVQWQDEDFKSYLLPFFIPYSY